MTSTPKFMYGTAWKEDDTARCVRDAVHAGFRAVDTACQRKHYYEAGVGSALKQIWDAGSVKRSDIFLQTKYTYQRGQDHRLPYDPDASIAQQVEQSFKKSLENLHTDYLDSYVLHGPWGGFGLHRNDLDAWTAMETLVAAGKTKAIGISNVSLPQLQELTSIAKVKPAYVQNRCYARTLWDKDIRDFCKANGIVYQGFSLLTANIREIQSPTFSAIARRNGFTLAQTTFAFARQVGMLPLTGTTDAQHMQEDLLSLTQTLSSDDLQTIETVSHI